MRFIHRVGGVLVLDLDDVREGVARVPTGVCVHLEALNHCFLTRAELAAAVDALEALQERVARASAYSGLLFAADTSQARHGALLQRVQERASEIKNALVFAPLFGDVVHLRSNPAHGLGKHEWYNNKS